MTWAVKHIHNISRPGELPGVGDVVEVECEGGFVCEVDPITRRATSTRQQFVVRSARPEDSDADG